MARRAVLPKVRNNEKLRFGELTEWIPSCFLGKIKRKLLGGRRKLKNMVELEAAHLGFDLFCLASDAHAVVL